MAKIRKLGAYYSFMIDTKRASWRKNVCFLAGPLVPPGQVRHSKPERRSSRYSGFQEALIDGLVRRPIFLDQVDHAMSLSPDFSEDPSEAPVEMVAMPGYAAIRGVIPSYHGFHHPHSSAQFDLFDAPSLVCS